MALSVFLLSSAPLAAAVDPFHDQLCVNDDMCYGAGTCVPGVACVPRGCEPVVSCRSEIGPDSTTCHVNATIDGRTCATYVGFSGGDREGTRGDLRVVLSNGSVNAFNLENAWTAPGAEGELSVLGLDFGGVHAYAYRSDIETEGPRGGPFGQLAPGQNHTWTQIGVVAGHHGGPFVGEDVAVAVELLDFAPEGCWVRAPSGALPELACPSFAPLYP